MDFMKAFDQAVREIKREVNLKVLKVPEIEQKVLDATNDEPWGPHGSALAEIAQATKKFTECQMIMNVLWTRLTDTGPNWRHVYKALSVIEYLVANGSERAVDDVLEHTFQISSLSSFEYVEPSGKDVGLNVRKKVETILALVNDNEKIQSVRNKASANRDKYFGLSSTGITYKSSHAAYGSSSFQKNDRYGGFNDAKEDDTFRGSYKDTDDQYRDDQEKVKKSYTNVTKGTKLKMGTSRTQSELKPTADHGTSKSSSSEINTSADDFDDFDPRDSTSAEAATTNVKQVDLFRDSLIGDLMDVPTTISSEPTNMNAGSAEEFDLFAGATFVSASSHKTGGQNDQSDFFSEQPSVVTSSASVDLFSTPDSGVSSGAKTDLFSTPDSCAANGAKMDLFSIPDSSILTGGKTSTPVVSSSEHFDPFAAVPLNPSEESDLYGAFTSNTDSASQEQLSSGSNGQGPGNLNSTILSKPGQRNDGFQVKSGIWADSLSRGLIDLNLTAPKKVALSDVGVVGGHIDGSDDTRHTALYTGRGIGAAPGHGKSAFPYPSGSRARGGFPDFGL